MRFLAPTLAAIARGEVTTAFRRGDRRPARPGGHQRTPAGELAIATVDKVDPSEITEAEAKAAGFPTVAALLAEPLLEGTGPLWRVTFALHADPRAASRNAVPDTAESDAVLERLAAKAARADFDPLDRLRLIRDNEGRRAPDLAAGLGLETQPYKRQIRRLKELGLTESLKVGYRLSPRGRAVLDRAETSKAAARSPD